MKKLMLITLVLTLAMGIVWVPSIAAADPVPITIHKTIPAGGPSEAFTFEAYRDINNNGILDFVAPWPDKLVGEVVIVGAGTGVINTSVMGRTIIHEVLIPNSAYQQLPDQVVQVACPVEVTFDNELGELGELIIKKVEGTGNALAGATFVITPDPKTGTGSLTVVDNGLNDEDPAEGVLLVTGCIIGTVCTVEETVVPDGYTGADPQTVTISATVTLTFFNTIPVPCRITGGGTIGTKRDPRVTHGFELHCNVGQLPNNLEVNWGGDHFHLLELTFAECWDDPAIDPKPPRAGCDTYHGIGVGRYNGVDGYQAEWVFTDAGESGKKDWAWIKITDSGGNTVMEVSGFLKVGNQQFHDCTGKDLR